MSFRISNILDYDTFLAIDIGSFKIKVLVCKIESDEVKVIGMASTRQNKKDMLDGEISDIISISTNIKKTISKACANLDKIPEDAIVLYNSSELVYDLTSVNYVRKNPKNPISMKEIDTMIEDVEIKSLDKIKNKTQTRLGLAETEMKLITTSITGIYVDGKRLSNPIGFEGTNIKFNIINVFSSVSKFALLKNIISDIGVNLISIVPLPISLTKLVEETSYNYDQNIYIDIGYSKITVIVQNNSEILGFNVINFGYQIIENELKKHLNLSYLDIENILSSIEEKYSENSEIFDQVFDFLADSIAIAIKDIENTFFAKNVFLSGAGVNSFLSSKIKEKLEKNHIGKDILVLDKYFEEKEIDEKLVNSFAGVFSLAKVGKEMMKIKKDPLVRVLKYVIYKYE